MQTVFDNVTPVGYRLLIKPVEVPDKIGSVMLPDQARKTLELTAICAEVISVGPEAYSDGDKFTAGPWVKKGDFILISKFGGARFAYNKKEYRIINDDEILAVIDDPSKIEAR